MTGLCKQAIVTFAEHRDEAVNVFFQFLLFVFHILRDVYEAMLSFFSCDLQIFSNEMYIKQPFWVY